MGESSAASRPIQILLDGTHGTRSMGRKSIVSDISKCGLITEYCGEKSGIDAALHGADNVGKLAMSASSHDPTISSPPTSSSESPATQTKPLNLAG